MDISKLISDFDAAENQKKDADKATKKNREETETKNTRESAHWLRSSVRPIFDEVCEQIVKTAYKASVTESIEADEATLPPNSEMALTLHVSANKAAPDLMFGSAFSVAVPRGERKALFITVVQNRPTPREPRGALTDITNLNAPELRTAVEDFIRLVFKVN